MSTRSAIIMETGSGFAGVYCHFDGYPAGVGATLLEHYQDPQKVADLIALGGLSDLGREVAPEGDAHDYDTPEEGVTVAYGRDRGEEGMDAITGDTADDVASRIGRTGHVYLFSGGEWTHNGEPLADAVERDQ